MNINNVSLKFPLDFFFLITSFHLKSSARQLHHEHMKEASSTTLVSQVAA